MDVEGINLFRAGLNCIEGRWENMRLWPFTYYFPSLHVLKDLQLGGTLTGKALTAELLLHLISNGK